jgi:ubiquinone/menaquinone biosynthesis C-methylase UbiE
MRGVSERLRRFVAEMPWERESIFSFVRRAAGELPPGARVLDVGAGDAPYRELFAHADYRTVDWEESLHPDATHADVVASADAIPLPDGAADAIVCTQVLEHVPEPVVVLRELHRLLVPGGRLYLTAPLAWELHELPHDYYRYTENGLAHLLSAAGFADVRVDPRNDCFTTVAQLMRNLGATMGRAPDGLDERRAEAAAMLVELADRIAVLAPLDARRILPLGYQATARKPA